MTAFAFAAAGTGGHVFPALAVADELVAGGTSRSEIVFFGGKRVAATAVPAAGYEYVEVPLQGLQRSITIRNLGIPLVVMLAARQIRAQLRARDTKAMLATGGYVTVPAGWAAKRAGVRLFLHEQNAKPGLANRVASRWAERSFLSVPVDPAQLRGEVTGTPLRAALAKFDREALRPDALTRYNLLDDRPIVGILGGSLGARALNDAVPGLVSALASRGAVLHLTGKDHVVDVRKAKAGLEADWKVTAFEDAMQYFYAASDLVVCRGGATTVSELTATGTPALVVPRRSADQEANAAALAKTGAVRVVLMDDIENLPGIVAGLLHSPDELRAMAESALAQSRPDAAARIAAVMREAVS